MSDNQIQASIIKPALKKCNSFIFYDSYASSSMSYFMLSYVFFSVKLSSHYEFFSRSALIWSISTRFKKKRNIVQGPDEIVKAAESDFFLAITLSNNFPTNQLF